MRIEISNNLKSFLSDSVIYTVLNLLNKAIPFILLPIVIRMVNSAEFGYYSLFVTLETLLLPIVSLNIYSALSKHFYIDDINLKEYISTIFFTMVLLLLPSILISLFIPLKVFEYFGLIKDKFFIAIFTACILGLINLVSNLFRLQRKPWHYGVYSILQSLLLLVCIISFCSYKPSNLMLILGRAFYALLFFIISIYILYRIKMLTLTFSFNWLKKALKFSLPTVFYSLSALIFSSSDRFFIQHYLGVKEVGYYSAVFQVASLISILAFSINAAWMPWLFENLKKQDLITDRFIVKLSYILISGLLLTGILFCFIFSFIAKIVLLPEYYKYNEIAYPIIMGFVFQGIYFVISPYIFFAEKTKYNGYIGIIVALINVSLNMVLIPFAGIRGAAYTTLFTWISLSVLFFLFSSRVYPMPWFNLLNKKIKDESYF